MKKKIITGMITMALSLTCLIGFAQEKESFIPKWVSKKGYWVAESNVSTPLEHTIWFYNNDNQLVYKETLTGVKLNLQRRKVKMQLKKVLETSLVAWQRDGHRSEDMALVRNILK